jgi:hypothetical protein
VYINILKNSIIQRKIILLFCHTNNKNLHFFKEKIIGPGPRGGASKTHRHLTDVKTECKEV